MLLLHYYCPRSRTELEKLKEEGNLTVMAPEKTLGYSIGGYPDEEIPHLEFKRVEENKWVFGDGHIIERC